MADDEPFLVSLRDLPDRVPVPERIAQLVEAGWDDDAILDELTPRSGSRTLRRLIRDMARAELARIRERRRGPGRPKGTGYVITSPDAIHEAHARFIKNKGEPPASMKEFADFAGWGRTTLRDALARFGLPWPIE